MKKLKKIKNKIFYNISVLSTKKYFFSLKYLYIYNNNLNKKQLK